MNRFKPISFKRLLATAAFTIRSLIKRPLMTKLVCGLLALSLMVPLMGSRSASTPKNIVAVFAHADDETGIAPVLAKYAEQHNVYLVLATDGRYGLTEHAGLEDEAVLTSVRAAEAQCSAEKLGLNPPILLGLDDGLGLRDNMGAFFAQVGEFKSGLQTVFETIQPDVVITYGSDGETGHPDHRLVSAVTTEVLLQQPWQNQPDLYYFSWSREQAERFDQWGLSYADQSYLDTMVEFSPKHEAQSFEAIRCYTSQFTPEDMDYWLSVETEDTSNRVFFRRLAQDLPLRREL